MPHFIAIGSETRNKRELTRLIDGDTANTLPAFVTHRTPPTEGAAT